MPESGPPLLTVQGLRIVCQSAANSTFGRFGSRLRSPAPASSLRYSTRSQVAPPSVERYTPRSGLRPKARPSAATYTVSGSRGCTRMRLMWRVASRPRWRHDSPPSSLR